MSSDDWAAFIGFNGVFLPEQPGEEDPFSQEKKKAYAACLRHARHIRRPSTFHPRNCDPLEDDLSATGNTRSDSDPPEDDLPSTRSTRSDRSRDGSSNEATSPATEDSPLAVGDPAEEETPLAAPAAEDGDGDVPRPAPAKKGNRKRKTTNTTAVAFGNSDQSAAVEASAAAGRSRSPRAAQIQHVQRTAAKI